MTLVEWSDVSNGNEKKKIGFKLPFRDFPGVIEIYSEHEFKRIQDILSNPESGHSPDKVTRMLTIKWEQPNHFYICFPFTNIIKQQPTPTQKYIVAMDPGVRTFQTSYDLQGSFTEVGKGDFQRLVKLCLNMDKLISKASKFRKGRSYRIKRRRMNAAIQRYRQRIKNLVDDLHGKLVSHLT